MISTFPIVFFGGGGFAILSNLAFRPEAEGSPLAVFVEGRGFSSPLSQDEANAPLFDCADSFAAYIHKNINYYCPSIHRFHENII